VCVFVHARARHSLSLFFCVCVCVGERERERERDGMRVCMCAHVHAGACEFAAVSPKVQLDSDIMSLSIMYERQHLPARQCVDVRQLE